MLGMEVYYPYDKKNVPIFSNWDDIFEMAILLLSGQYRTSETTNPITKFILWQKGASNYIESLGIKDDIGFSNKVIFSSSVTFTKNKEEIRHLLQEKINILRILKDRHNPSISKEKIFDYSGGQYYLNGQLINPTIKTLYYVLFDATYKITPSGGDILYSELKNYLIKNKAEYTKDKKKKTFGGASVQDVKHQVQSNLLGGKGILAIKKVQKYLKDGQKHDIFFAIKNGRGYTFKNKQ